ncbi:MAG: primary-amine oxidase [Nocardioidaceae bacterium]
MSTRAGISPHPLAPLSQAEIRAATEVVRNAGGTADTFRFVSVELREPDKADYLVWRDHAGKRPGREAFIVLLDVDARRGVEAVVSLDDDRLISRRTLAAGVQPATQSAEVDAAAEVVRTDPDFTRALAERGITDPARVHIECWTVGAFEDGSERLVRAISWLTADENTHNPYARPLYGLVAVVDLYSMRVVRVDDHAPGHPPPSVEYPYHDGGGRQHRQDVKPLEIAQPAGPSFSLEGHRLRWQKWDLLIGFHPREGLVLHDIAYADGEDRRQICHRASIAELLIPYGDPNPTVHFKNVFDTGEFGIGPLTNSLTLGCDCLGEIRYLDAVVSGASGEPLEIPHAICIHEEDDNLLWKHTSSAGRVDRARSRRLVISSIATVGNYEYGYYWYFYQDGSWEFEAKLTGIVHTAGALSDERGSHALPLGDGLVTSVHQHFFCARLDLDVDGIRNVAFQTDAACDPWGPGNPDGTAFGTRRTTFDSELAARADTSPSAARRFRVENTGRRNRIGDPVSYELVPGENVRPMQQPDSSIRGRARMLDHQLWVTRYAREQRYPAGEYPNQSEPGDGISRWTQADRPLAEEDVVLWYVFGAHHVPRLEDWPVMPVATCGFTLRPVGFFDFNPALDVPPPVPSHCG